MPRFYLHICNGNGFVEDEEGLELADEAAARDAALKGARDVMAGDVQRGELDLSSFVEVEDEQHRWLFTISFADAVALRRHHDEALQSSRYKPTEH